jgi:hypothetical protein
LKGRDEKIWPENFQQAARRQAEPRGLARGARPSQGLLLFPALILHSRATLKKIAAIALVRRRWIGTWLGLPPQSRFRTPGADRSETNSTNRASPKENR